MINNGKQQHNGVFAVKQISYMLSVVCAYPDKVAKVHFHFANMVASEKTEKLILLALTAPNTILNNYTWIIDN